MLIGIAGGSGSGKTTLANNIIKIIGNRGVAFIQHDSYYKDSSHIPFDKRRAVNYDSPDAFESELLISNLNELINGRPIKKPVYDFKMHVRKKEEIIVYPRDIIILEGILIFVDKKLREMMDLKIFLDIEADIRLCRRIRRDIIERDRDTDSIIDQWEKAVKPMYDTFVAPSKEYADIIYNSDPTTHDVGISVERIKGCL